MDPFKIDGDIARASGPPRELYFDPAWFERVQARVLRRTWQLMPGGARAALRPWSVAGVPVIAVRDGDALRCLSNVCTHRANLLVDAPCDAATIRCRYHGRRFALDGRMTHMPEFDGAAAFPSARDDLPQVACGAWGPLVFASLQPEVALDEVLAPVRERVAFVPVDELRYDEATSRDYVFDANWALYCDNYLEGFHIPFVHPGLNQVLDYGSYATELLPHGSLQLGIAGGDEACFELPAGHVDAGRRVAAYYFWLFPTAMINVYPWGLSVNVVIPEGPRRTRVRFDSWVWRPELRAGGAGAALHQVELEDEAVVLSCQRGVESPLYTRARYAPARERGVHHFHRLLARFLG